MVSRIAKQKDDSPGDIEENTQASGHADPFLLKKPAMLLE